MFDLPHERCEVGRSRLMIFRDDHIARAKQAKAFAEGKMQVERHRRPRVVRPEVILPYGRCRVTGIARSRPVVPGEILLRNAKSVAADFEVELALAYVALTHVARLRIARGRIR